MATSPCAQVHQAALMMVIVHQLGDPDSTDDGEIACTLTVSAYGRMGEMVIEALALIAHKLYSVSLTKVHLNSGFIAALGKVLYAHTYAFRVTCADRPSAEWLPL